jgi:hypothetical protein
MNKLALISLAAAALITGGTTLASAQVKTEEGGKGVSSSSEKGEMGRTDPKGDAAVSAKEPKGGVQVKGQPEPKTGEAGK